VGLTHQPRRLPTSLLLPFAKMLASVRNHHEAIAAMDFFTVPTNTFRVGEDIAARYSGDVRADLIQQMKYSVSTGNPRTNIAIYITTKRS
jgi:hypothetical protein